MMSTAQDDFAPSIRWWVIWLVFIPSWMIIGLAVELADLALSSTFSGFADQWYTRNFVLQNLMAEGMGHIAFGAIASLIAGYHAKARKNTESNLIVRQILLLIGWGLFWLLISVFGGGMRVSV